VEERRGSNLSAMEFLDVECDQRNIIRMPERARADRKSTAPEKLQKQKPPGGERFSSWVETPSFQARGHFYEDVGTTFSPIKEMPNDAKILGEYIFQDTH